VPPSTSHKAASGTKTSVRSQSDPNHRSLPDSKRAGMSEQLNQLADDLQGACSRAALLAAAEKELHQALVQWLQKGGSDGPAVDFLTALLSDENITIETRVRMRGLLEPGLGKRPTATQEEPETPRKELRFKKRHDKPNVSA